MVNALSALPVSASPALRSLLRLMPAALPVLPCLCMSTFRDFEEMGSCSSEKPFSMDLCTQKSDKDQDLLISSFAVMDPKHSGDVLKHLEKQKELLMDAYRSTSHELHSLQIEEEMLMRKYYEFMAAQGLVEKNTNSINRKEGEETGEDGASVLESRGDVMTNEPDLIIGEHRSAENANESTEMDQENGPLMGRGRGRGRGRRIRSQPRHLENYER